jgi:hypothetical protein
MQPAAVNNPSPACPGGIGTPGNHQNCPGIDREAVYSDESGVPFSPTANIRRPTAAAEDFLSTLMQPEMESNCPWRRRGVTSKPVIPALGVSDSEMKTIKAKGDFALRGLGIDETCSC